MKIDEIKHNFAVNIVKLRKSKNLNQIQLGEALHYSSKAVSKWENEETIPDIDTLSEIAEFFDITVDDLISGGNVIKESHKKRNVFFITLSSALLPYFIATIVFVILHVSGVPFDYSAFPCGAIASGITLIVLTRIWYRKLFVCLSSIFTIIAVGMTVMVYLQFAYWWLVLIVMGALIILTSVFFLIHIPSQDKSLDRKSVV